MNLDDMPSAMRWLPKDKHGRPCPWFIAWINGKPDFRVIGAGKVAAAVRLSVCWVCGRGLGGGGYRAFVIGPMCAVNHLSAEPPSHEDCAIWSARNCPFLTTPSMVRREHGIPEGTKDPAGIMIKRNPGVTLVAVVRYRNWRQESVPGGGSLFRFGDPVRALWFAEGRAATRAQVQASLDSGLPELEAVAFKEGPQAQQALARQVTAVEAFLPPWPLLDGDEAAPALTVQR